MLIIYHNNRCGKSREALKLLAESGKEFRVVEYLREVPGVDEIRSVLHTLGIRPHDLIRTKEPVYQEKFKGKDLTDALWIQAIHENPILMERPIVINGSKAVIARPPEKLRTIL